MSGFPNVPFHGGPCPFCGVATQSPHESQERCIAALHAEIGRMRDILATLKPTGGPAIPSEADHEQKPTSIRLRLTRKNVI